MKTSIFLQLFLSRPLVKLFHHSQACNFYFHINIYIYMCVPLSVWRSELFTVNLKVCRLNLISLYPAAPGEITLVLTNVVTLFVLRPVGWWEIKCQSVCCGVTLRRRFSHPEECWEFGAQMKHDGLAEAVMRCCNVSVWWFVCVCLNVCIMPCVCH